MEIICVSTGHCWAGKRRQGSRWPHWNMWRPAEVREVRVRPTGQSGPVPGEERQRLQMYHWNSWILCRLDVAIGIHLFYSKCLCWTSSMQARASQLQSPHSWPLWFAKRHHRDNFTDTSARFWDATVAFLFELLRAQWSETLCPAHVNRGLLLNTDEGGTTH